MSVLYCPWCEHPEDRHDYSGASALKVLCTDCGDGVCDITASAMRAVERAEARKAAREVP